MSEKTSAEISKKNSYGLIVYTVVKGKIKFLVTKRRKSYAYQSYIDNDFKTLPSTTISHMYPEEIKHLCSLTSSVDYRRTVQDLWFSKKKYALEGDTCITDLKTNIQNHRDIFEAYSKSPPDDRVWGFPRGKMQKGDRTTADCACREFYEETKIYDPVRIVDECKYVDVDIGENNVQYTTVYYLARMKSIPHIRKTEYYENKEKFITFEVGDAKWIKDDEFGEYLDSKKKELLKYILTKIGKKDCRSKSI